MVVSNYSVNEIRQHNRSPANELAVLHIALMVTVGRLSGGGAGCQRGVQCSASTVPSYRRDEVAPSILLAPSKEQAHLATELMTDGSRRQLFSAMKKKRPGPLALRSED